MWGSCRILFLIALIAPCSAFSATFPQLALGGGYESVIIVANTSSESEFDQAAFRLRTGSNEKWDGTWRCNGEPITRHEYLFAIPAQGTRKFVLSADQLQVGYLELGYINKNGDWLPDPPFAVSFFYVLRNGSGSLIDSTGIPSAMENQSRYILPVERSDGISTGLAMVPASAGTTVEITLLDRDGAKVKRQAYQLKGHVAQFVEELIEGVPESFVGSVLLAGSGPIYVTVLRMNVSGGVVQLTSVPVTPIS